MIKMMSNHLTDNKFDLLDPQTLITTYLSCTVGQTIKNFIFKIRALLNFAHTFERDTFAIFLIWATHKPNPLRNEPSISTVTEVIQMTLLGTLRSLKTLDRCWRHFGQMATSHPKQNSMNVVSEPLLRVPFSQASWINYVQVIGCTILNYHTD